MKKVHDFTKLAQFRSAAHAPSFLQAAFPSLAARADSFLTKMGLRDETTYKYWGGVSGNITNKGMVPTPASFGVIDIKLDFAAIAAARTAAGQAALASSDVLEVVSLQAGTWVPACFIQTVTAEGATATADLGDGTTAAGFISNADLNAAGWASSLITTTYSLATAGGKLYTADDTLDLSLDHSSIDVAVIRIFAVVVDMRNYRQ